MPKEIVYSDLQDNVELPEGATFPSAALERDLSPVEKSADFASVPINRGIVLRWSRERGHVEIATCFIHAVTKEEAGGQYVHLSPVELNKLIRDLKRAGRQAFGPNEW